MKPTSQEVTEIWNDISDWWDEQMGEHGDVFNQYLIHQPVKELLQLKKGEKVLDIACGNGSLTRKLAATGAQIVAFDASQNLLEKAKNRSDANIDYRLIDATDPKQLASLSNREFDAAVCSMAMHDIPQVETLIQEVGRLLRTHGRFVISIPHPCFNTSRTVFCQETRDVDGKFVTTHYIKVSEYLTSFTQKSCSKPNQPLSYYHFHRPLNVIFKILTGAGFVLNGLEESVPSEELISTNLDLWNRFSKIPYFLAMRWLLL